MCWCRNMRPSGDLEVSFRPCLPWSGCSRSGSCLSCAGRNGVRRALALARGDPAGGAGAGDGLHDLDVRARDDCEYRLQFARALEHRAGLDAGPLGGESGAGAGPERIMLRRLAGAGLLVAAIFLATAQRARPSGRQRDLQGEFRPGPGPLVTWQSPEWAWAMARTRLRPRPRPRCERLLSPR